ncbi:MAG: rhodanese-like domain-containing protein [Planctomycetota bacterium]|nr:rhodanese-like domain-containing protein [Planctomycetota bacterium]
MSPPAAASPGLLIRAQETSTWRAECLRALAVLAFAGALGLVVNRLIDKPVPLLSANGPGALPERATRISLPAFTTLLSSQKALLLLDVRTPAAFNREHAPGALNAPSDNFAAHYQELSLSAILQAAEEVVLLCESDDCPSADRVARFLRDLKHENVRVFEGGWGAYVKAGLQVERTAP